MFDIQHLYFKHWYWISIEYFIEIGLNKWFYLVISVFLNKCLQFFKITDYTSCIKEKSWRDII